MGSRINGGVPVAKAWEHPIFLKRAKPLRGFCTGDFPHSSVFMKTLLRKKALLSGSAFVLSDFFLQPRLQAIEENGE